MPQFVMEGIEHSNQAESAFVHGFIQVLFFTNASCFASDVWNKKSVQRAVEEGEADGCLPNDVGYTDLHPDALTTIRDYCATWQINCELLQRAYETGYSEEQAGMDLHYTHCGHGVGYWDREILESDPGLPDALTTAAGSGEISPYYDGTHVHVSIY